MRTVESMMTINPCCCTPEMSLPEVARLMVKFDCGEIPVVDDFKNLRIMGVITDRDIVCRAIAKDLNPTEVKVTDVMTFPPITITPYTSVDKCCELMEENRIRRIPVVDDFDRICGMISQADIVRSDQQHAYDLVRAISRPNTSESMTIKSE